MSQALTKRAATLLAIPNAFRATALAFPAKIEQALALIDDPRTAKELLDRADAMAHYANRVKADTEIVNAIQHGKLKIVAKLGELMPATPPKDRGRGKEKIPQADAPFSDRTKNNYRNVAKNQNKIDDYCDSAKDKEEEVTLGGFMRFATGTEKAGASAHVSSNTGVPEWYTPQPILDAARKVLGVIDLDPASSDKAQKTVKAKNYFTINDDGLSKSWAGRVWMNPPYTSDLVTKFVGKLCKHFKDGEVEAAILLVNNATETKWFQAAAKLSSAVCFPESRVKFLDEDGQPGAPLQGQAVLYFGKDSKDFLLGFKTLGVCFHGIGVQRDSGV